jgi:hypothetical protein
MWSGDKEDLSKSVFYLDYLKTINMKKIIDELINCSIKGVDVYRWKNATWLIFTDETRWVVELTDEGTLWYNYKFFKDIFKYVSITVGTEMDGYIIQWANDYFYKDCAHRSAAYPRDKGRNETPKVLEHGIKDVSSNRAFNTDYINMVVDGGIKEIGQKGKNHGDEFEWHTRAVISKGIKEVYDSSSTHRQMRAENLIPKIVKDAKPNIEYSEQTGVYDPDCNGNKTEIWRIVEEVKPNVVFHGIDEKYMSFVPSCNANNTDISLIVKSGIKNIYPDMDPDVYNWSDEFKADNVIQGGTKL